jgi:butyrate kinase
LPTDEFKILAINPGSTSTKFAVYVNESVAFDCNLRHSKEDLAGFQHRPILEQQKFRCELIEGELRKAGWQLEGLSAIAGRGGLLRPLASGTYRVCPEMLDELRAAPYGEHASNLGAFLAQAIANRAGVPAYIVDPVSVDEWPERARLSGSVLLDRPCQSHALNTKAVAKRFAREQNCAYENLRLVVAHLGSGISVSAHEKGRMVDVTNSRHEGAFSTERAGSVPCVALVKLCFSGRCSQEQVEDLLFREGGLSSYLGTKDLLEVERRIAAGDAQAALVFDAMGYQIAKEIGAMATVLKGRVDGLLFTGGMAKSARLVSCLRDAVEWIAPVHVYPGEDELEALASGVLRVLRREEEVREFAIALVAGA